MQGRESEAEKEGERESNGQRRARQTVKSISFGESSTRVALLLVGHVILLHRPVRCWEGDTTSLKLIQAG